MSQRIPYILSVLLWCWFLLTADSSHAVLKQTDFGYYHALLIANQRYDHWDDLKTPHADIDELASILRVNYGFEVRILTDANRDEIVDELEFLKRTLTSQHNLLIYYAGHGKQRKDGGYWIGVDAVKDSRSRWLHYGTISTLLDKGNGMRARHVIVVADSCYSGAIFRTDESVSQKRADETHEAWLLRMHDSMARVALTSGATEPVVDHSGSSTHSIFAQELIRRLKENKEILEAGILYDRIKGDVHARARRLVGSDAQAPMYGRIAGTGDAGGDFLFVPTGKTAAPWRPIRLPIGDFGIRGEEIRTTTPTGWERRFGGSSYHETANAALATPDGGYIIAGRGRSNYLYVGDLWVTKLDIAGQVEWERFYQHEGKGYPHDVQLTPDGGYVIAGYYRVKKDPADRSPFADLGLNTEWLVKLDSSGGLQWSRTYRTGSLKAVIVEKDAGYVVASYEGCVRKLNAEGDIQWERSLNKGFFKGFLVRSIQPASDTGYVLAGSYSTRSMSGWGERVARICKIDTRGVKQWEKTYNSQLSSTAYSLQLTRDGGYVVVGETVLESKGGPLDSHMSDVFLLKLNARGSLEWERTYSRSWDDRGIGVAELSDGSYAVAVKTGNSTTIHTQPWVFKVDKFGTLQWERLFQPQNRITSVDATPDGGLVVAGHYWRTGSDMDAWVAKLDASGNNSR